jgi:hypothetical protein
MPKVNPRKMQYNNKVIKVILKVPKIIAKTNITVDFVKRE